MTKPIPDQVYYYMNMMAFQKTEEVDKLSPYVLRARLKSAILTAKMVKLGVDVYDVSNAPQWGVSSD